jgi:phosphatidylglycerol---prolipoprotein diacylglyceryl transferase
MTWVYPTLMGAAIATGVIVSRRTQKPLGLSPRERLGIGLAAFCGGMLGAKLPFVLMNWEGLISGKAWFENGKTIMLGLVGGYFGVEAAKWAMHIRVKTGDGFAAPVAAAIAVGRLACFFGGCCFGTVTDLPWGVNFGDGLRRHPTQLYEFGFHLTCAIILTRLQARGLFRGQLIKLYILTYLIYRFATEYIRPEEKVLLGLTAYQWAALVFAPVFAFLWLRDRGGQAVAAVSSGEYHKHGPDRSVDAFQQTTQEWQHEQGAERRGSKPPLP